MEEKLSPLIPSLSVKPPGLVERGSISVALNKVEVAPKEGRDGIVDFQKALNAVELDRVLVRPVKK